MYKVELTKKAEKTFKKLAQKEKKLIATIYMKFEQLESGNFDALNIKAIKRKHGKYKINEVKIRYPSEFRIFYVCLNDFYKLILIVDGKKKKVNSLSSEYFTMLDSCIDKYLNSLA